MDLSSAYFSPKSNQLTGPCGFYTIMKVPCQLYPYMITIDDVTKEKGENIHLFKYLFSIESMESFLWKI